MFGVGLVLLHFSSVRCKQLEEQNINLVLHIEYNSMLALATSGVIMSITALMTLFFQAKKQTRTNENNAKTDLSLFIETWKVLKIGYSKLKSRFVT